MWQGEEGCRRHNSMIVPFLLLFFLSFSFSRGEEFGARTEHTFHSSSNRVAAVQP